MSVNRRRIWFLIGPLVLLAMALSLRTGSGQNAPKVEKDVVYGEAGGQKLLLDVYRPDNQEVLPAVVFVHGGGWSGGNKRDFGDLAAGLTKAGYVSFSVGYRLVTREGNTYPAQLDDVQRAVRWIRAHAKQYNVDPNRIGALGASAGGHLVALLGTRETRDNSDAALAAYSSRVNCVIDIFGPTDFTVPNTLSDEARGIVVNFLGKTREEAPEIYRDASPITHIDKKTVPFLIFHGTADPLVPLDQSQRFHDALRRANIESTFIPFEGEGHGFKKKENNDKFVAESLAFLNRHLKTPHVAKANAK
jgi:acetyl esterase/lipase